MRRALLLACSAAMLLGCATQYRRTVIVGGQRYCAKHHRPLITVRGFQSSSDPLVLVHSADPRSVPCDERSPNRIYDDQRLTRTKIHVERADVTYCPVCAAEYWQCMGGALRPGEQAIRQIAAFVLHCSDFRQPLIRIVPMAEDRVLVVGGHEEQVGDVFTDLGVSQRHGRWVVTYPGENHRIIALGRSQ